jgi:heme/copper-type cytochrome/quinol oxidase subunit 3
MSDVTRSARATTSGAAAGVESERRTLPNGWWGAALLVATEATLFGTLIASYFYLYGRAASWPPPGIERPSVALPLILTGALVATTLPILRAASSARAGRAAATANWVTLALAVQSGYLAVQILEYKSDLESFTPSTGGAYASSYFTLLTVHHAHVLVGILLDVWLLTRLAGGLTTYRVTAARVIALYWGFVNAAAIAVVLTLLSPSL